MRLITSFTAFYGSHPLHLLGTIAAWALAGYPPLPCSARTRCGTRRCGGESIAVWFVAAVIGHDLILFPLYALADRSLTAAVAAMRNRRAGPSPGGCHGCRR